MGNLVGNLHVGLRRAGERWRTGEQSAIEEVASSVGTLAVAHQGRRGWPDTVLGHGAGAAPHHGGRRGPGPTETAMLEDPARVSTPPRLPPPDRYVQPDEVAGVVVLLLRPDGASSTGQQLVLCGGASL